MYTAIVACLAYSVMISRFEKKETLLYAPNVNTNDKFSVKHFFVIIIFI